MSKATFPVGSPWHIEFGSNIGAACGEDRIECLAKLLATAEHERHLADFEQQLLKEGNLSRWVYSQLLRLRVRPHQTKYFELVEFIRSKEILGAKPVDHEVFSALTILAIKFKDDTTINKVLSILRFQRPWMVVETFDLLVPHKGWRKELYDSIVTPTPDDPNFPKLVTRRLDLAISLSKQKEGRRFLVDQVARALERADASESTKDFYGEVHHLEFAIVLLEGFGNAFHIKDVKTQCRVLRERAKNARKRYPLKRFESRWEVPRAVVTFERSQILRLRKLPNILLGFASKAPWPNIDHEIQRAQNLRGFADIFTTTIVGRDGRHVATISAEDEKVRHKAFRFVRAVAQSKVQLLVRPCFTQLKARKGFHAESVVNEVCSWGWVTEYRERILLSGIAALFDGNFPTAAHILVPAFEDMVRRFMIALTGGQTTFPRGSEQYHLLHPMLKELALLTADEAKIVSHLATWWDWYFCDGICGNTRNSLAHGLISDQDCEEVAWMTWLSMLQLNCLDPDDLNSLRTKDALAEYDAVANG